MPETIKLSDLVEKIEETVTTRFANETFWITAEITDVKRYTDKRWCFLKFIEKDGNTITAESKGVFWGRTYHTIDQYEKITKQEFKNGIKIDCCVAVRFHKRYGISLEILNLDYAKALGELELEKQKTLQRLVKEKYTVFDGERYKTKNNSLELPVVIQKIALVTASNSDGQRDFIKEIQHNKYGYAFSIEQFCCPVQGDHSSRQIMEQLKLIEKKEFDVVVIVRGGGSQIDLKSFDNYDLAKQVASCPTPILTGIGHDGNTSIVDLMARQHKTPTKVATFIVDINMNYEAQILGFEKRFFDHVEDIIEGAKDDLEGLKRIINSCSPTTILNKGFAIIVSNNKIVTNPNGIKPNSQLQTLLKSVTIHSTVTKKTKNEKRFDI